MILFKNILARILKNNLDLFSRLFFKIILPKSWKIILNTWPVAAVRGGFGGGGGPPRRPTDRPRGRIQVFGIAIRGGGARARGVGGGDKLSETLIGRLPPEHSFDCAQTCQNEFQMIPDTSSFDAQNIFLQNFERPFTSRGLLRLASNFGKTHFRWSPTFHFSTLKKVFGKMFRQKISSENWQTACLGGAMFFCAL